jgi:hypothetical protein
MFHFVLLSLPGYNKQLSAYFSVCMQHDFSEIAPQLPTIIHNSNTIPDKHTIFSVINLQTEYHVAGSGIRQRQPRQHLWYRLKFLL